MFVMLTTVVQSFNPRSRVGSDNLDTYKAKQIAVSIHAPAWGATRECRKAQGVFEFQSTLPRGERRTFTAHVVISQCFNPRSRVGSDCQ